MIELSEISQEIKEFLFIERTFIDEAKLKRYKNILSKYDFAVLLHDSRSIININSFIKDIYSVYYE